MGRAFALWTISNFYSTTQPRFGLMGRRLHRSKDSRISSHSYLSHLLRRLGMEKPWSSLGSSSTNCTHLRWQPLSNINPTWNYPTRILMFVIHRSQSTNGLQWWQGKLEQGTITSMREATVGTWGILTHILTSWTCSSWTRAWHLLPQSAQTQYFLRKDWSLTRHFVTTEYSRQVTRRRKTSTLSGKRRDLLRSCPWMGKKIDIRWKL